jgi:hypothetical protein
MRYKSKKIIIIINLALSFCLCHGTTEQFAEIKIFGNVPSPGKLVLPRTDRGIVWTLDAVNFSLDQAISDCQKGKYSCRIFIVVNDFQVDYDVLSDSKLFPKIMLPNECIIFISKGATDVQSSNEEALKRTQQKIVESRIRLAKLIDIGSVDSLKELERICHLNKEIDILEKNEFELDPKKISDSLDMHLSREVSSLTKSKRSLKLKEILVIERESTMLGNSHPEILFLEKIIKLL